MRVYETTFILSPQADDAAFDRQIKSVTDLINRQEGKILHEDRWGIRRLAYSIAKFNQGYYTRLIFEGNNNILKELERLFRLEEHFIRHLTVNFESDLEKIKESERPFGRKPERRKDESVKSGVTESKGDAETKKAEKPANEQTELKKDETANVQEQTTEPTADETVEKTENDSETSQTKEEI
jgi:small subunit ribosomal protein S6